MSKNLITRILVASVAIPTILYISYQGGAWLFGMMIIMASVAMLEFLIQEKVKVISVEFWLAYIAAIAACIVGSRYCHEFAGDLTVSKIFLIFFVVTALLSTLKSDSPAELFQKHSRLVWGVLYIGLLYPFLYLLGEGFVFMSGGDSLLFLFALMWTGDTFAMFIGGKFGKHKLAPTVSPNKSVEGFVGGLLGAILVTVIFFYWKLTELDFLLLIIGVVGASIFGQLGDLVESMWKRSLGIEDSSAIIPGHGGMLDRFDSLLFASPFLYYYFSYIL